MSWYQWEVKQVLDKLDTSEHGLDDAEAASRLNRFGSNTLRKAKEKSKLAIFLAQFKDIMILILVAAAIVSVIAGESTDAIVIIAIIIINAIIGFYEEFNAEKSIKALQQMAAQYTLVRRSGITKEVEVSELVPGDIILLEAGNIIPADARVIEQSSLKTEEAALTGESESVHKTTNAIDKDDLLPADQHNMLFKGTIVANGTGVAVVTDTGMDTEIGKIAGMLDVEQQKTPLQLRLQVFSKQLAGIVIGICIIVFVLGWLRGEPVMKMFLTALSLAVAALPEALLVVVTIGLAQGARRMVRQQALVRKLPAVETLGSVTYICSDKTGTLTQNKMTVTDIQVADSGDELLLHAMMLNNEVRVNEEGHYLGDPTEIALVNYALSKELVYNDAEQKYPILQQLPFDSERMMMSTQHLRTDGKRVLLVKGAPVKVLHRLSGKYTEEQKTYWRDVNRQWAADGKRVLFFAYRYLDEDNQWIGTEAEQDLEMLGAVAMIDPPREEVIEAIQQCKRAGISPVMITGDQPVTAMAIARQLKIINDGDGVLTGAEIKEMGAERFSEVVKDVRVYARVSPGQKLDIVKALQDNGAFVAMTGDGVNDAPSLKQANIGVAMGVTGTDVAKEAAHMILLDDNFSTIVRAVKEGRRIYDNIRKFVLYILSCNMAEILTILCAPMFGLPIPLLPIHILWINLVTDGLPGVALATEPAEKNIMRRPPRDPKENLFAGGMIYQLLLSGIIMAAGALGAQYWAVQQGYDVRAQQTVVFTVLCFIQLANVMSVRSVYKPVFAIRPWRNPLLLGSVILTIALQMLLVYWPPVQSLFKTSTPDTGILEVIILIPVASLVLIELIKLVFFRLVYKRELKP